MQLHTNFISNIARSRPATDNIEQVKVLIEHNIGQAPIEDQAETSVLFGLIAERYERCNLLISTNQPFFVWNSIFRDPSITIAAIDHLAHHSTNFVLNVESYHR